MNYRRILRHVFRDERSVKRVVSADSLERITRAIAEGEKRHDGEVRFCIEAALPWSYLRRDAPARERAVMLFSKLRVWDTERNTGVLVYVLLADRAIEIVADRGIARCVPQSVWNEICSELGAAFRQGQGEAGVIAAIGRIGAELARHFPPVAGDVNELPDAPVVL
ncbi:MAG: TPM domain-containing protein [Burkholderiales bacterium]|nr:TPM domain-containing protein [Burkholderiales bacterium]